MISYSKRVHEIYHKGTTNQNKFITDNNFTYRIILSVLNPILKKNMKILDIGCGAGTLDFYLANKGFNITGIDISDKAINECKKTAQNLNLKNVNFKVLDFPNEKLTGKYDLIIFTEVIEHLKDDNKALQLINKALNPGGLLFLTTPTSDAPLHKLNLTKNFDKRVGHLRRYSKKEISNLLTDNNFKINKIQTEEGILRNSLYVFPILGKSIRFFKGPISEIAYRADIISKKLFGSSNMLIVCKKTK